MNGWNTKTIIAVHDIFLLYLAFLIIFVPLRWVMAMCLSVVAHEMGHILCLLFMKIPIMQIDIQVMRIQICTEPMEPLEEFLCAAAGPMFSAILLLFAKWLPATAICAAFHCCYNLFPVLPADGGRMFQSCVRLWKTHQRKVI